ncbi:hypothetical protein HUE57_03795 [Candidatus Reidiella endopervernicosa]|uniref:YbaK/aminoacyl-tRNA synthetase-associated domain-containing protein n=1 Tax=Candidatus Reidiella endopervernicosa TaxID=2738883 RepID=A0A6N0I0K4_9GAMM|nr:hypothetical protein HUE57_03795 [Candidatus Reidiella endopervernicosa]
MPAAPRPSCVRCVITSSRLYTTSSLTLRRHKAAAASSSSFARASTTNRQTASTIGANRLRFAIHGGQRMKTVAKSLGAKRAEMASQSDAERATGYLLGGISPLGQKRRLKSVIDQSAQQYQTIYVSAGRRGLEIELAPNDLCRLASASFAAITQ